MASKPLYFLAFAFLNSASLTSTQAHEHNTVYVGGSAESIYDANITDLEISISLLFKEIMKKLNEQPSIKIFNTDRELLKAVDMNKLDVVFTSTLHYLEIEKHFNNDSIFAIKHGESVKPRYFLLVKRNGGAKTLNELQGKKISIPSGHRVGKLFLDVELLQSALPASESFFSEIRTTNESNTALVNLFFNQVDAALVTEFSFGVAAELNPQIHTDLKVLIASEPFIQVIISATDNLSKKRIEKIFPYLENLDNDPRLEYLTKSFHFNGIRRIDKEEISGVRELYEEYKHLTSHIGAP